MYKCSSCKKDLKEGEQPCPYCGHIGRDISVIVNETIGIKEKVRTSTETLKRNYPWFIATVAVTMSAPFITTFLHPIIGIVVGLGFGYASLRLGKKAYVLLRQISESG